jgi:uncharacterized protein
MSLRTSSYVIYVDLPGTTEEMLLVHGYSGAYDRVSRRVATYVRSLEARRPPRPLYGEWTPEPPIAGEISMPSAETIGVLRERGYLTEMPPAVEGEFFAKVAEKLHAVSLRQMPRYIFMPTYECNLRCAYCFQDHMRTDPRFGHLLRTMTPAVVDRVMAALPQIEERHGVTTDGPHHRDIGFFGGEPFLAVSRPIVEYIIERARAIGRASFWAITNATELDAYADLLGPGQISTVQITLDGPPAEHDRRRIYADGSGSFARIAANIDLALERGAAVSVRLNLDRNNLADLPHLTDELIARTWDRHPKFSVYAAPIRPENAKTDKKTTLSSWELDQALADLAQEAPSVAIVDRPDDKLKHQARQLLLRPTNEAPVPNFRESFCSAHTGMYIFDAFADIYSCWERTGDQKIRSGRVQEDGTLELNFAVQQDWQTRTVASNPACRSCRYALHCGGGCAVLAQAATGRYHANFCDGFANRFRASVAEAFLEHLAGKPLDAAGAKVCDL